MDTDVSHLALVSGVMVAINTVSAMKAGKEPIVPVIAGGLSFVSLAIVGGLLNRMDLATAIAYVFLVSSLFLRGVPLIRATTDLAKQQGRPFEKKA